MPFVVAVMGGFSYSWGSSDGGQKGRGSAPSSEPHPQATTPDRLLAQLSPESRVDGSVGRTHPGGCEKPVYGSKIPMHQT